MLVNSLDAFWINFLWLLEQIVTCRVAENNQSSFFHNSSSQKSKIEGLLGWVLLKSKGTSTAGLFPGFWGHLQPLCPLACRHIAPVCLSSHHLLLCVFHGVLSLLKRSLVTGCRGHPKSKMLPS